jgi:hypothetical protein
MDSWAMYQNTRTGPGGKFSATQTKGNSRHNAATVNQCSACATPVYRSMEILERSMTAEG